ncbi:AraC family transcriptional regulator [Vibrio panuliri]|uniref:AraC family transcriptional regulator n=1 Tax=Vibrio panuliri TaxID=1381081 RepID=A0A1Q9HHQ7_9VIBR|nr:AraC family transcriptional regulator [Vibrio panuliri]OLQ89685.1 AraC family transcriptional regulator [Vibrio panuliri]
MRKVRFIRALGLRNIHFRVMQRYGLPANSLAIADSVLKQPMTLIPVSEANRWYQQLELQSGNPDIILDVAADIRPEDLGAVARWLFSGIDLASAIRRLNYGIASLQSGAYLTASQSGPIIKWAYQNPFIDVNNKAHDGVRAAIFMCKVIRHYAGEHFTPMRIMLPGSRSNQKKYSDYFGCDVGWNHSKTEVWFPADLRLATQSQLIGGKKQLAMSFAELDEFLNMPEAGDEIKVIYEVLNYSCHYGFPTVERVSSLVGLSPQQFQRRLHAIGMNFTNVTGYVLSNIAVGLLDKGVSIEEVSQRLGYQNVASFNRMFKKQRALTPKQFIKRIEELR